jgi:hypothetical protein
MQSRVQRALLDLQHFARDLLNAFRNGPTMLGFKRDGLQDQKVERPLDKIVRFRHTMVIYNRNCRLSRYGVARSAQRSKAADFQDLAVAVHKDFAIRKARFCCSSWIANPQDAPSLALVTGVHRHDKRLKFWLRNSCRNAPEHQSVKWGNLLNRCGRHVPASHC